MNLLQLTSKVVLVAATIFSAFANAGAADFQSVSGSGHDLTVIPEIIGGANACAYCHVVDSGSGEVSAELNRGNPGSTITLYDDGWLSTKITGLAPVSSHCMSCHDGETPFDALGESAGTENNNMRTHYPGSPAIIGPDLNNHHPIGVLIPENRYFREISVIESSGLPLFDKKMECSTCHDVHGGTGFEKLLVSSNENSALCSACHIK